MLLLIGCKGHKKLFHVEHKLQLYYFISNLPNKYMTSKNCFSYYLTSNAFLKWKKLDLANKGLNTTLLILYN